MIREATLEDIPQILRWGKEFADEAGVSAEIGWDEQSVIALLHGMIGSDDGILLVSDTGMLGGVITAHPFNRNCRMFLEMFWRSHGREGLRLLKEAERIAKERGATRSAMIGMADMPDLDRLYRRLGYAPLEKQYIKGL